MLQNEDSVAFTTRLTHIRGSPHSSAPKRDIEQRRKASTTQAVSKAVGVQPTETHFFTTCESLIYGHGAGYSAVSFLFGIA